MRHFLVALTSLFLLFISTCKQPVGPPRNGDTEKTLVWQVDTLGPGGNYSSQMQDIWAIDSSNIYVAGYATGVRGDYPMHTMFHFDGGGWATTGFHIFEGGPIQGITWFSSVLAFSSESIWMVGERLIPNPNPRPNFVDSSLILRFNGSVWEEDKVVGTRLYTIWGTSPGDVWTGSRDGKLFHSDGSTWTMWAAPREVHIVSITGFSSENVYALGTTPFGSSPRILYFFHWNGSAWSTKDSTIEQVGAPSGFGRAGIRVVGQHLLSFGYGVFRWEGTGWTLMAYDDQSWFADVFGRSSDDFYIAGSEGKVFHYRLGQLSSMKPVSDSQIEYLAGHFKDEFVTIVGVIDAQSVVLRGTFR